MIKTALNARITQELYEVLKEKYPNDYVEKVSEFYKEFKTDSFVINGVVHLILLMNVLLNKKLLLLKTSLTYF